LHLNLFEIIRHAALLELLCPVLCGEVGLGLGVEVAGDGVGEVLLGLHRVERAGGYVGLHLRDL
jgi:hypothetical protein